MSRFASDRLQTIDLGDGEWVKIPVAIPFREVMEHRAAFSGLTDIAGSFAMMLMCLKEWNIKDENGEIPPITEENIMKLDIITINILTEYTTKLFVPDQDKKKSPESSSQLTEKASEILP